MTAEEFAEAIGTIQNAIVGIIATALPKALVLNRWVMDTNGDQWAALLESPADTYDAEESPGGPTKEYMRVHAVTVAYYGLTFPPASSQQLQSIAPQPTFAIDFFYQYEAGDDTNNSEHVLRLDTGIAAITLWKQSDLGIRPLIKGHQQLQMQPAFDVIPLGRRLAHKASGTLTVLMQSTDIS